MGAGAGRTLAITTRTPLPDEGMVTPIFFVCLGIISSRPIYISTLIWRNIVGLSHFDWGVMRMGAPYVNAIGDGVIPGLPFIRFTLYFNRFLPHFMLSNTPDWVVKCVLFQMGTRRSRWRKFRFSSVLPFVVLRGRILLGIFSP